MNTNSQKIPTWFWIVSIALLLWNIMGIMNFLGQVNMSQEAIDALSETQKSLIVNRPSWVNIAFGLAVFAGTAGSIALLLKKKIAHGLFMASLVGVALQFGHGIASSPAEVFTPDVIGMTVTIITVAFLAIWFSRNAFKKGWLK
ncbi:MAG: hypothetical protein KC517_01345 [Bacteroidetes bacterium]|jgi:hypothetical protein|nr:hypothetical protein [Bacteroidota bacterium]